MRLCSILLRRLFRRLDGHRHTVLFVARDQKPDLIILDELFSGLSLAEVAGIVPIIEKLRREGKTIIMIEHRLKELFRIADRVLVLNYGEKIAEGKAADVMESEVVKKAYLGSEV